jgi:hypothetical protein
MSIRTNRLVLTICLVLALVALSVPARADVSLSREDVSWQTMGTQVRFHLRFHNPDPSAMSGPVSGTIYSQEFGAFVPHFGTIGVFDVPPIEPESFFDVYFDVPLSSLPPSAGGLFQYASHRVSPTGVSPPGCPPDDHWDGNVDIVWNGLGGAGQLVVHNATMFVCAGLGRSLIHVVTNCVGITTWAIAGVCQGFAVSLLNEQPPGMPDGAAPANLPPGWMGFIAASAAGNIPVGTQCCFTVTFTCMGVPVVVNVCVTVCNCTATPAPPGTWGHIRRIYR